MNTAMLAVVCDSEDQKGWFLLLWSSCLKNLLPDLRDVMVTNTRSGSTLYFSVTHIDRYCIAFLPIVYLSCALQYILNTHDAFADSLSQTNIVETVLSY